MRGDVSTEFYCFLPPTVKIIRRQTRRSSKRFLECIERCQESCIGLVHTLIPKTEEIPVAVILALNA